MNTANKHVVITGGAGYIGSLLTAHLLRSGWQVTVLDSLLFGGEALLSFLSHPNFHFCQADISEHRAVRESLPRHWQKPNAVVHLAGIVGFPACQSIGKTASWRYNVEATKTVHEQAESLGVERFVYASTYSVYGSGSDGAPVSEESELNPQSLYAETKVAAEETLKGSKSAVIFRLGTLFGLSPRTRFDLVVNQFVLDAYTRRELLIYQRGYTRSFVHVLDVVRGLALGLEAPQEQSVGQTYNLGTESGTLSKDEVVQLVIKRLPETFIRYKNLTFGGDSRDLKVSFEKIRRELNFNTTLSVDDGVRELVNALKTGIIRNPYDERYRNARFIVQ